MTAVSFNFAGSDVDKDGCQLSLPARIYAIAIPVSSLLLFNIVALIRTAFAIRQHGHVCYKILNAYSVDSDLSGTPFSICTLDFFVRLPIVFYYEGEVGIG